MKTLKIIIVIILSISIISCRPSRTIIVHGNPGTTIHYGNASRDYLGTIGEDGKTKVRIKGSSIGFQAYLLSKNDKSDEYIPFALNYKRGRAMNVQYTIATIISFPFLLAGMMLATLAGEDVDGSDLYSGYDYKYLKHQTTNEDLIP